MAPPLSPGSRVLIGLIRVYQRLISPLLGPHCRFTPTCSQYGIEALRRFGVIKGSWLTMKRVLNATLYTLVVTIPSRLDHLIPENTNDGFATQSSYHRFVVRVFHDLASLEQDKIRSPSSRPRRLRPQQRVAPPTRAYRPVAVGN